MADVQDTSGSLSTDAPNPYADMSSDEYAAQFDNDPGKPKPKGDHPVQTFWDKLLHGVKGQDDTTMGRTGEMIRGMAHGVAQAGMETVKTIGEGAAYVDRKTGLGEAIQPGFNDTYDAVGAKGVVAQSTDEGQQVVDHYLGRRTDDPLASFTESATQFMSGWAATGELKGLAALKGGAHVAAGLARGAVVDASMFDPYQAQLAELAAKAPLPVAKQLGQLLSVNGDDSAIVARLKRAAAGLIPAATIEGLVAASRVVRTGKAVAAGSTDAVTELANHAATVNVAANGELHPEGMDFIVNPRTLKIEPVLPKTTANGMALPAISLRSQVSEDATAAEATPSTPADATAKVPAESPTPLPPNGQGFTSPVFSDYSEAAQQAESINSALNARKTAGQVDEGVVKTTTENVAKALESPTPENLGAVSDGNLNISYQTTGEDAAKIANDLAAKFAKQVRQTVESQGEVHVEQSMRMALNALGDVPQNQAHGVMLNMLERLEGQSATKMAAEFVRKSYSDNLIRLHDVIEARPHDPVALEEFRTAAQNYFDFDDHLAAANSDTGRSLRLSQERPKLNGADVQFADASGETPKTSAELADAGLPDKQVLDKKGFDIQGMDYDQLNALGRIFKMSGGEPRNAQAITAAAQVIQKGGFWRKALEVFTNGLLSGPATVQTVLASSGVLTHFEPITRVLAGAAQANGSMIREGADMIAGAWKYAGENLKVAATALRDGRSVIDPAPQTIAIGGTTGKVIRTPGSVAGAAHEFAKVTNYRAWIYAKSLREGRASGLDGTALASYVENNLRAAFSKDGVAVVPDALKYAQLTSLSTPLKEGSFGSALHDFTRNALAAKFIAPFVKISTNVMKYTWQSTPGLNMFNAQAREIMSKGGEEAAILHARSALAGSLGLYAYGQASQGNLTGRGPSDPQLRSLWLKDNQPYSFRVNKDSPWHSYQRFEPLAKTVGLMADFHTIRTEMQDDDPSVEHLGYAALASFSNNLASSTYMKGIMDFANTWGSDNPQQVGKWMQNMAVNFTPFGTLMGKANPDPIYREVRSLHDAYLSRVPGYSETLDPRYQWDGAPILKTPGVWNRMSVSQTKPHSESPVESELLRMNQALVPFPQKFDGIDLSDRTAYDNGTGKSPYSRLMDLINNPQGGGPNLRDDMTNMVKSDDYKGLSDAAYDMSGGPKMEALRKLKTKHELEALSQLREEYPKLDNAITGVTAMKRQNKIGGGDDAVQAIEQEFGTRRPFRGNNFSKH